jgi:hypothetical protein
MNIQDAFRLTNTLNKKQLGEFLGIRPSAVYQWDESDIPSTGKYRILEKLNLLPNTTSDKKAS